MTAIKIVPENKTQIEAALAKANGKAYKHTYTDYAELADWPAYAEKQLEQFGVTKASRSGARFIVESGSNLPNAYNNAAIATRVTIERRSSAWYLVNVSTYDLWPRYNPKRTLHVTQAQADEAVRRLLATVVVQRPEQVAEAA